jgi:hypothetical protein
MCLASKDSFFTGPRTAAGISIEALKHLILRHNNLTDSDKSFVTMAQCNFSIPFSVPATEVADKAKTAIMGAGGNFQGDATAGAFDISTPLGTIRGSYAIQNSVIHVAINSKPFLVSCNLIEKQLRGYFEAFA